MSYAHPICDCRKPYVTPTDMCGDMTEASFTPEMRENIELRGISMIKGLGGWDTGRRIPLQLTEKYK